jgi:hypothetical protein
MTTKRERWPDLPINAWWDTHDTLHRWTQIVGKTRMTLTPLVNHWWNSTLYVTPRGLTTATMHSGDIALEIEFDFVGHLLHIRSSNAKTIRIPLRAEPVADFYNEYVAALRGIGVPLHIVPVPNEVEDATPFPKDTSHAAYDPEYANRFWRILLESDRVFNIFRARFVGKASPSHFFWGGMDLAVTRFSGRQGPKYSGGGAPHCPDYVQIEGYSHELLSAGFWPGAPGMLDEPAYYAYAYPATPGFGDEKVKPSAAFFDPKMGEFFLPYEAVRTSQSPDDTVLDFLQSTYEAGAKLMKWDRPSLERKSPGPLT